MGEQTTQRSQEPAGPPPTDAAESVRRIVHASFATEQAVYGVLLVSGMIVVAGLHGGGSLSVFWTVFVTVVVFWAAHVYAGTVAGYGLDDDRLVGLGESFRHAVRRSWGLLASSLIPSLILLAGALRAIDDKYAIWAALWVGVAELAVLGWIAFTRRGAPWWGRVLGSLVTASFGVFMILAKAFIH
ncbi:hypothetical protein ET445_07580 [Agromyces protaetiae]|uniref:Uncharacterized protein n=1 Tax=Agromyces protaetiae TaxID=2509455 RepID=A0A4P6FRR8_9MICO|nr:hypothetical protein [Agromyces protaetiae]QAY73228.1 hypothetical protein ET445_07580 [Agromyces protaetiae]